MDGERINVEKLEGESNWLIWKFQIRQIMEASELFDIIDNVSKPSADSENYVNEMIVWKKLDAKARRVISTTCMKQPLLQIMNCETANEMWSTLKGTYEQTSRSNILFLQQKYYSFSKEPEDNIATFLSKLMAVVQQLKDQKEVISDSMIITKILMALPGEYNHFHSAWESTSAENQNLANLRSRLMAEELRLKSQGQENEMEALITRRNFNKKFSNFKKGNVSENNGNNVGFNKNAKIKGKCFQCGKVGHWKRDCRQRKGDVEKNTFKVDALVCQGTGKIENKDRWILDSGASDHMCNQRTYFDTFTEINSFVTVGNGKQIKVQGKGNIQIRAFNGHEWIPKFLMEVLYVPDIHVNLFSSGKAMDKGYQLNSNNRRCELMKEGNVIAVGVRREQLFEMMFEVVFPKKQSVASVAIETLSTLQSWHERLGHQNVAQVKKILKRQQIKFLDTNFECEACIYGKSHRGRFKSRSEKSKKCGEIIYADVCGPMQEYSIGGSRYFLLLKDDYSHFRFVYFLKHKSEVVANVKKCLKIIQKEHGHHIRYFRSDNGTEFVNKHLKVFFDEMGVQHQRTIPYTPEQNGCAEREMRTIVESARTMIHSRQLNKKFWAEAVNYATFVLNRTGTSTVEDKSPYELWFGKSPKIDMLRIFGSEVFVHIPKEKRRKLDPKAVKGLFVGFDGHFKRYRFWNLQTKKIEIACDVFLPKDIVDIEKGGENKIATTQESNKPEKKTIDIQVESDTENQDIERQDVERQDMEIQDIAVQDVERQDMEIQDIEVQHVNGRGARCDIDNRNILNSRLRSGHMAMVSIIEEPKTYEQAMECHDHKQWEKAMDDEYGSLIKNKTWSLVKQSPNQKIVDNRWVYKVKQNPDGSIDRYKARLVVRGFTQEYGLDYEETFSPVVRFTSVRVILALAASKHMKLKQFDVKTAFLYGVLEEDVFMKQPIGYDDGTGRVCKLIKSLYGLKQASRCWNKKFSSFIEKFKFKISKSDPCVFIYNGKEGMIILAIYVDDGLIAAENESDIACVIEHLKKEFEIKVFELKCFLGFEIDQKLNGSIHISQKGYTQKILERFNMADCNVVSTPSDNSQNLSEFKGDEEISFQYRQSIGSLMYLAVGTRPDISFAVGNVSRYMERPAAAHINAVKRIFKYLNGTKDFGIYFEGGNNLSFCGYSDADYAGDIVTRRSTSGYVFMYGGSIISWGSERQKSVALSTTESEYIAGAHAIKELIWLKLLLEELAQTKIVPIFYMDNQSAIRLIKNPEFHKRTKHIDVRYHFIREKYEDGFFDLKYIGTNDQIADIMTKALSRVKHQHFRTIMNVIKNN